MRYRNALRILCVMMVTAMVASRDVRPIDAQRLPIDKPPLIERDARQPARDSKKTAASAKSYGQLPVSFEPNLGQTGPPVKFLSRARNAIVFLTGRGIVLGLTARDNEASAANDPVGQSSGKQAQTRAVVRVNFLGANPAAEVVGDGRLPGKSHYLIGNDPGKWRTNIPRYATVRYRDVYPGIDLVFYGEGERLEYDFVISPGADPSLIKLLFEGAQPSLDAAGDLVLATPAGELRQHRPFVYQTVDELQRAVASRYIIDDSRRVGFQLGTYDAARSLVIDPVLSYSTYLGGGGADGANAIAVDSAGNAYVTGETLSVDFPASPGGFQTVPGGGSDVFVAKLDPMGTTVLYSTYLGGNDADRGGSIAVDAEGSAYVTGRVASANFPTSPGAFRSVFSGGTYDAFVTKLSPDGSALSYSTYLGGTENDAGYGIALDAAGSAYVTGGTNSRDDFPLTGAPFQNTYGGGSPGNDAFVTKIDPTGSNLEYSSYLGGSFIDRASGIAVDGEGSAYVTGWTESPDFPLANPWQPTRAGVRDAYVTKVSPDGSALVFSTFLGGGSVDVGFGIAVDGAGSPYVTGYTESANFPTMNAAQPARGGGRDAFVTKFDATGSALVYSTYLGGGGNENVAGVAEVLGAIAVDGAGSAYVTGATASSDFPTADPIQAGLAGGVDAFVTRLDAAGSALVQSTYLGGAGSDVGTGIAVDSSGAAYVTGQTSSGDFPVVNPLQPALGGGSDAFLAKLVGSAGATADLAVTMSGSPDPVAPGGTITYSITATNNGPDAASDVTFADEVPPYTTFLGLAPPADWSCTTPEVGATGAITCTTALLAADTPGSFTLDVLVDETAPDGTLVTNTASVSSATSDPDSTNNSATATTTVMASAGTAADVSVSVVATPEPVEPGSNITYWITVTNTGPDAAVSAWIFDELPFNTTFQTVAPPAEWSCTTPEIGAGGAVTCTTSLLAPGATESFTLDVQVDASVEDGTSIDNVASAGSSTPDPDATNNSATVTSTVMTSSGMAADLTAFIMASPDPVLPESTITYWIAVTNNGPDAASSLTVSDDIPLQTVFQAIVPPEAWSCSTPEVGGTGNVSCTSFMLEPGETAWIMLDAWVITEAEDGSLIVNIVSVDSATPDPDSANNSAAVTTTVSTATGGRRWSRLRPPAR